MILSIIDIYVDALGICFSFNLIQKQPNCKKKLCSPQEGHCEKDVKSKVAAKKWLWWQIKSKNFNNDNSGKFVLPSPHFTMIRQQIHLNCRYYTPKKAIVKKDVRSKVHGSQEMAVMVG